MIERLQAETEYLRAQTLEKNMATLRSAVAVLKELGLSLDRIRDIVSHDPRLIDLIGSAVATVLAATDSGQVTSVSKGRR